MEVRCYRTGDRQYQMRFHRGETPLCDVGGPGFDPWMPHDLCHFIVERELRMSNGIYGFLAALIKAGWLEPGVDESPREKNRRQRHAQQAAEKLLAAGGRDDGPRSERAGICLWEWQRRSKHPELQKLAREWAEQRKHSWSGMPEAEKKDYTEETYARVCAVMDDLSAKWRRLEVGQFFSVEWPDHLIARPRPRAKGRAAAVRPSASR